MRKDLSPEALHHLLYPPLLIWALEFVLFPWTYGMSVLMAPKKRVSHEE